MNFDIATITNNIYRCLERACVGDEPIKALLVNNSFVPKEGWLWDYKESASKEPEALAKTILQIVSFYNSCGGYIIYGVREAGKDKEFTPMSIDSDIFNSAQIRDKIKNYTNAYIDCTFCEAKLNIGTCGYHLGILYIPKRPSNAAPLQFIKNGPQIGAGKFVFSKDETYFRFLDECKKATTPGDWQLLFSPRTFNMTGGVDFRVSERSGNLMSHNLPDRNLICSRFVGRESVLSKLWAWLADEFEYVKILSGDGGKGKTSIAYEFCRSFSESSPPDYERILWLSVKVKQFSGITNSYYELKEADFNDCLSFLVCLADNFALNVKEYDGCSDKVLKRDLKESLPLFPSIIIVDDIDSLDEEEQKRVVDACRQLGSMNVRFLITTRKKHAYSSDLCLDIQGMEMKDFESYINTLIEKYSLKDIKTKEMRSLHEATDGSPLLAASILRLFKQGIPLAESIRDWKGQAGEDARSAALKREIQGLSSDAKRILLTIYYLRNCSFTEIKQVAAVEKMKLVDCLEELQSLFLVSEPRIIDQEERFSISNTTFLMVSELKQEMAYDYRKLEDTAKKYREKPVNKKIGNRRKVGLLINQALALLRERRYEDAIATVDSGLKEFKLNPDLLLMKARCFVEGEDTNYNMIRDLAKASVDAGQNKELVYEYWYQAEEHLSSSNGMIEVSTKALLLPDCDSIRWLERQARGLIVRSTLRDGDASIKDLLEASHSLTKTLDRLSGATKDLRVQELYELHNLLWRKLESSGSHGWLSVFDTIYLLIKQGDTRTFMYNNAARCLIEAKSEGKLISGKLEAYKICWSKFTNLLKSRPQKDISDRPFDELVAAINIENL